MESLILKLQAEVAARKRPRSDSWPSVRVVTVVAVGMLTAFVLGTRSVGDTAGWSAGAAMKDRMLALNAQVDALQGQVALQQAQIERYERMREFSVKYSIPADLAEKIEEIALAEGVEPELAFDLVRVESEFNPRAVSSAGALGYTQLMPSTAAHLQPGITRAEILDRDTNLRLGFRYLGSLVERYRGDITLALLAYNRGPFRVDELLSSGVDPSNGYARRVLGGSR
jgi:soluble lytic murein transglycosylase-like protein